MTIDKNTRRVLAVGVALAFLGFCGIWLAGWLLDREPVYRGKRLSAWLDERRDTGKGPVVLTGEAETAIRAIGPAAIPTLLSWIEARDSVVTEWATDGFMRIGRSFPVETNADKRRRAMYGFRALGMAAKPVWPRLADLVLHVDHEGIRGDAINALTESDAETIKQLTKGLESNDWGVRARAIRVLAALRQAPGVSVPALKGALKHADAWVRRDAAKALWYYQPEDLTEESLLALRAATADPDVEVSVEATRTLAETKARLDRQKLRAELEAGARR
jgi:HEAT repeat protein